MSKFDIYVWFVELILKYWTVKNKIYYDVTKNGRLTLELGGFSILVLLQWLLNIAQYDGWSNDTYEKSNMSD